VTQTPLQYAPPANVDDFDHSTKPERLRAAWHDLVSGHILEQSNPSAKTARAYPGQRSFFDALGSTIEPAPVSWFAFPQALSAWYPDSDEKRWEAADTLFARRAATCKVQWDDEGKPVRVVGTNSDITERKRSEESLRNSERRFRALIEVPEINLPLEVRDGELQHGTHVVLGEAFHPAAPSYMASR